MNKQAVVLMLCSIGYVMSLMSRSSPAVLSDYLVADFAFSASSLGLVSASTMLSYGFMQLPAGVLADMFGPRKILIIFTLIAGIATLGFAFSQTANQVIIARFFIGVGVSLSVISITMVSLWFTPQTFARANSILCAISEFGPVLAASPLVLLIGLLSWRGAMVSMGLVILSLAFLWYFFIPEKSPLCTSDNRPPMTFKQSFKGVLIVVKCTSFWPMCIWQMMATGSIYMMLNLWWIPYLIDTAGYSVLEASSIISIAGIALIGIQASVGFLSDIVFKSRKKVLILISCIFLISAIMLVFATGHLNYGLNLMLGIMLMAGISGSNICNTMVKETFPPSLTGTALGCFNMFYPIWTALMQVFFGFLLTYTLAHGINTIDAYKIACSIVLVCAVISLYCSFIAKDTYALSH